MNKSTKPMHYKVVNWQEYIKMIEDRFPYKCENNFNTKELFDLFGDRWVEYTACEDDIYGYKKYFIYILNPEARWEYLNQFRFRTKEDMIMAILKS